MKWLLKPTIFPSNEKIQEFASVFRYILYRRNFKPKSLHWVHNTVPWGCYLLNEDLSTQNVILPSKDSKTNEVIDNIGWYYWAVIFLEVSFLLDAHHIENLNCWLNYFPHILGYSLYYWNWLVIALDFTGLLSLTSYIINTISEAFLLASTRIYDHSYLLSLYWLWLSHPSKVSMLLGCPSSFSTMPMLQYSPVPLLHQDYFFIIFHPHQEFGFSSLI